MAEPAEKLADEPYDRGRIGQPSTGRSFLPAETSSARWDLTFHKSRRVSTITGGAKVAVLGEPSESIGDKGTCSVSEVITAGLHRSDVTGAAPEAGRQRFGVNRDLDRTLPGTVSVLTTGEFCRLSHSA